MPDHNGLIPGLGGGAYYLYPKPNPALSEILLSTKTRDLTTEWSAKVIATYMTKLAARKSHRDHGTDPHLEQTVDVLVYVGGYDNDRWVGEITQHSIYALADEWGRDFPSDGQHGSTTEGHHDLANSLYENLPQI